jgi:hypothetical protein
VPSDCTLNQGKIRWPGNPRRSRRLARSVEPPEVVSV